MIKALIFDVDGVITQLDIPALYLHFSRSIGLPENFIADYYKEHLQEQLLGHKLFSDLFLLAKNIKPVLDEATFKQTWLKKVQALTTVNTELLELIDDLRTTYTCGVLTDNSEGRAMMDKKLNLSQHFDFYLESHKEHLKKPDPKFFYLALSKANCKAEEAVFIDDKENLATSASSLGMHGITFIDNSSLKHYLQMLNVKLS